MKVLRLVNFMLAVSAIAGVLCVLIMENINLLLPYLPLFMVMMFFLFGVEKILDKDKLGYAYVVTATVVFSGWLMELVRG